MVICESNFAWPSGHQKGPFFYLEIPRLKNLSLIFGKILALLVYLRVDKVDVNLILENINNKLLKSFYYFHTSFSSSHVKLSSSTFSQDLC